MTGLDRLNKEIYDTYHSKKNKEMLPIVIFFSVIAIIFKGALFYEAVIWVSYYAYCCHNNEELNKDPKNLEHRKFLLEFRRKILSGECKFKED